MQMSEKDKESKKRHVEHDRQTEKGGRKVEPGSLLGPQESLVPARTPSCTLPLETLTFHGTGHFSFLQRMRSFVESNIVMLLCPHCCLSTCLIISHSEKSG